MSRKEVPRAGLVKAALAGRITNAQGAAALRLTIRQFQRLKGRVRTEGAYTGEAEHRDRSIVNAPIGDRDRSEATLAGRSAVELALLSP